MAGLLGSLLSEADRAGAAETELGTVEKVTAAALEVALALETLGALEAALGWAAVAVKAARCLSLEILRGRGAALRAPLASTLIAFAGEAGEVEAGCWRPCWCGRWWHAVRRRPHWLHRARGSSPLSI